MRGERAVPGAVLVLVLVVMALAPRAAPAHRINVFAYVEDGRIKVEAYFNDGAKARNGDVKVCDERKALLVEGKTDRNGECEFDVPAVEGDLVITVSTGDAHMGKYTLKAEELAGTVAAEEPARRKPRVGPSLGRVLAGIAAIGGLTGVAMFVLRRNALKKASRSGPSADGARSV